MLRAFPMILIAIVVYNALIFGGGAMGHDAPALLGQNFPVKVFSGDIWKISLGDGLTALALTLLFVEVVKATRTNHRAILNHTLSMVTFVVALVEFIVFKGFGTSTFFLIAAMCLFDVVAGYTISIITAKRDLSIAPHDDH
jgi:hypothetical protein